jgi:transcriptional regulator with XRE-family HTH domain
MNERKLNIEKIRSAMESLGLNQSALANEVDVSRESISNWLKNEKFPRPAKLLLLAKVLLLSFHDLVIQDMVSEPQIAYRKNRKKKTTKEDTARAQDMGEMLKLLLPYLDGDSLLTAPTLSAPTSEQEYIQKAAQEIRQKAGMKTKKIQFSEILSLYSDFKIILIPVMWGPNGDNGLHIHLPESKLTFVYANLEKHISDF